MTHHSSSLTGWDPTEKTIHRTFRTGSFDRGVQFINAIAKLATAADHHPDILLTHAAVIVTLMTHDVGMVTAKDLALAKQINQLWDTKYRPTA